MPRRRCHSSCSMSQFIWPFFLLRASFRQQVQARIIVIEYKHSIDNPVASSLLPFSQCVVVRVATERGLLLLYQRIVAWDFLYFISNW